MTFHRLSRLIVVGAALLASFPLARAASAAKPNFVIILIDDMGYGDIEPFGSTLNRTPNLVKMAAEGLKLTSFYGAPVCTPSRAQLMTGCYAKRVSLPNVLGPVAPIGLSPAEKTIADLLRDQGYATMAVGKWHLGDQPEFMPLAHGFDHFYGLPNSNGQDGGENNPHGIPPLPLISDQTVIEAPVNQDTITTRYTETALKFITDNKDHPFFLYLPHTAVHVPLHPGADFLGKSKNGMYGDWVEQVDWSVGQVLDTLKKLKLDSNTLVVFSSDNGPWLKQGKNGGIAGPLRGGKTTTWEGGVREPTIAWWPGKIKPGTVSDAVASEMDLLPTMVKLAGGAVPKERPIDGLDLWPLLSAQTAESPHKVLFYFKSNRLEAARSGPWKLSIFPQADGYGNDDKEIKESLGKPSPPRLYNLATDVGEKTDVAAAHPDVVQQLQAEIAAMGKDLGVQERGPGVRPCGRVDDPIPLRKVAMEYD